ncbi:MAG: hypothetical protein FJ280_30420, partial [Planctomycetes bacterium]|nr:hypothetical protein [Planctomycetota bacterium]
SPYLVLPAIDHPSRAKMMPRTRARGTGFAGRLRILYEVHRASVRVLIVRVRHRKDAYRG